MRTTIVTEPPPTQRALPIRQILWPVLLSLGVLAGVAYFTFDYGDYVDAVGALNPLLFLLAALAVVLRVFFGGLRFNYISRGKLSLGAGTRGQLAWDFFSSVTPSAIGGGPLAIIYITRNGRVRAGDATAWTLFSMVLDQFWYVLIVPVVVVASFFIPVIPEALGSIGFGLFMLYMVGLMLWVVLFTYATIFRPSLLNSITDFVFRVRFLRRFRQSVAREMAQMQRRAFVLRSQPLRFYVVGLLLTVASWSMRYLLILFVVWGVYGPVDKVLVLLRGTALTLVSLVMPTPGGAGGIEGFYLLFFESLMPAAAVAPTLLAWRLLGYYLFVAIGIFITTHHVQQNLRSRRLAKREARAVAASRIAPVDSPSEVEQT
ncbi:MAG: lysylphosphatidylglycerol synthase transmembrane domain-containing protein [Rhodothermales bacterium]